jgi:RNA polymerase sigma-70 factor (ECF subfamily)
VAQADDATLTGWVLAAKAGDRAAATAFIRATQQQVFRFLAHLVHARHAEDLTRETYRRAMRGLPRFAAGCSARVWLYAVAGQVAADHIRVVAAHPGTVDLHGWPSTADTIHVGSVVGLQEQVALSALLDQLTPERRLALVATQMAGLSYEQAAQVCNCPVGTIRSRVARAREDLVAALRGRRPRPKGNTGTS